MKRFGSDVGRSSETTSDSSPTTVADPRSTARLTERLAAWPAARWKVIAAVVGAVGGFLAAVAALQASGPTGRVAWMSAAGLFGAIAASGGVLTIYLVLRQQKELRDAEAQIRALVNVRPLTGRLPLDLGEWAADPVFADRTLRLLLQRQPERIVECGSGWSTLLMASCLRELGQGRVVALEHLERFADRTRALLRRYGIADWAEVIHAPIEDVSVDGESWPWYGVDPEDVVQEPVEMLVVDGPPGRLAPQSRYPAVPLFVDRLADDWAVILDDAHRKDEAEIARRWGGRLGVDPTFDPVGKGVFVLQSAPDANRGSGGAGAGGANA